MTPIQKTLTAGGLGAAMFAGGMFGVGSLDATGAGALVDTADTTDTTADTGEADATEAEATEERGRRGRHGMKFGGESREAIADILGLEADDLHEQLHDGSTLAEIAAEQGIAEDFLVAAMVAQAEERLDEAVAEGKITEEKAAEISEGLEERIQTKIHSEHGEGGRHGHGKRGAGLSTVAEILGLEVEDLRSELSDGATVAEVAEANGVAVDTVVEALVAEAQERLDERVADGRITEDEAAEKAAEIEQRITDMVNGELPERGAGMGSGSRRGGR